MHDIEKRPRWVVLMKPRSHDEAHPPLYTGELRATQASGGGGQPGDLLSQLLELNFTVAARIEAGEPVTAPGIPPDYPNPAELVSEGCITPREWV